MTSAPDDAEREELIPDDTNNNPQPTPLDKTIDKIGMGNYQWVLLCLCGLGWLADNMWVQAVAIILPRVQDHYSIPDHYAGLLSSSVFAGMMFGAIGWGSCSDILGRSFAFNGTLFFTALFGLAASFAASFKSLCFVMFLLGSSVGGSMPTDGTLLLEHMPKSKQHLLTFLSVFFSIGAVFSSLLALIIVPSRSCRPPACDGDVESNNSGWKALVWWLGLLTLFFFILRILLFRLYESPRYLVSAGRPHDAIRSLESIARYNNNEDMVEVLGLSDVIDHDHQNKRDIEEGAASPPSTSRTPSPLPTNRTAAGGKRPLPNFVKSWMSRVTEVLCPQWRRTTLIVWGVWMLMALAYTIFNVYLPKLLESPTSAQAKRDEGNLQKMISSSLWDVVVFTLGGVPGPVIGAYMVNSPNIGKRLSLSSSTFLTGLFCVFFIWGGGGWVRTAVSIVISLSSGGMWAVLYGWTPEIFVTRIRGSACGIASALSRVGGMIAPLLGGVLLTISKSLPVYTSALVYLLCGGLVLMLHE